MRLLVKIVIAVAILAGAYIGYRMLVKGEKFEEAAGKLKESAKVGPMTKADAAYNTGKYQPAIELFQEALKDPEIAEDEKARAMRRIGDSYFKMWQYENNAEAAPKAKAAYAAYKQKYPKDYKEHEPTIVKNLEQMGMSGR